MLPFIGSPLPVPAALSHVLPSGVAGPPKTIGRVLAQTAESRRQQDVPERAVRLRQSLLGRACSRDRRLVPESRRSSALVPTPWRRAPMPGRRPPMPGRRCLGADAWAESDCSTCCSENGSQPHTALIQDPGTMSTKLMRPHHQMRALVQDPGSSPYSGLRPRPLFRTPAPCDEGHLRGSRSFSRTADRGTTDRSVRRGEGGFGRARANAK